MNEEKTKLLNLMRFWLFGTFVIVWAAITAYIGMFTNRDWWAAIQAGFPIWGITGALTIVWYVFYRWWLGRRDSPTTDMDTNMGAQMDTGMGSQMDAPGMGESSTMDDYGSES